MDIYNELVSRLSKIGIYNITDTSVIGAELKAYATGFDLIKQKLNELTKECFIATAQDYGLTLLEKLFSAPKTSYPTEQRREMLIANMNTAKNSFTMDNVQNYFDNIPIKYSIVEFPTEKKIAVNVTNKSYTKNQREYISKLIVDFLPCQFSVVINFL